MAQSLARGGGAVLAVEDLRGVTGVEVWGVGGCGGVGVGGVSQGVWVGVGVGGFSQGVCVWGGGWLGGWVVTGSGENLPQDSP